MRIAVLVNDIDLVQPAQTTARLALALAERGHDVRLTDLGDLRWNPDDTLAVRTRRAPTDRAFRSPRAFLDAVRGRAGAHDVLPVGELDVLLLRLNPARDKQRPWAQAAALHFARQASERGVLVLNDPKGLARATNKTYLQEFPAEVRPRTLITRDADAIRQFARDEAAPVVLKPMLGTGGASVFIVRPEDHSNLNQIIEVIARDDYVIAQEYLPEADRGDVRLLLMNGRPLMADGRLAMVARERSGSDIRSNVSAGGRPARAAMTDHLLRIAEVVGPQLVRDGVFLAGLDVIGSRIVEINVYSPGGLDDASKFEKVDFAGVIVDAIEQKVAYAEQYGRRLDNTTLATL